MKNNFLHTVIFCCIITFINIQCSNTSYPYSNPTLSSIENGELQIEWMEDKVDSGLAHQISKRNLRIAGINIRNGNHNFNIQQNGTPQQIALHNRLSAVLNETNYSTQTNNAPENAVPHIG
ncbi:MAG: hypothetical protein ACXWL5_04675 [Candidatus Chromulinivorax sp.]